MARQSDNGSGQPTAGAGRRGVLCFGPFAFDTAACRLSRDGVEVHLTPKAAAVLCHLLQHPGELISKDEFLEVVWEGVHVREESLTQAISVIRQMLGDSAQSPRYIQTVSGEGYRFIGEVGVGEVSTGQASADERSAPGVEAGFEGMSPAAPRTPRAPRAGTDTVVRGVPRAGGETATHEALPRAAARRRLAAGAVIVAVVAASAYLLSPPTDLELPTIVVLPATVIGQTEDQQLFAAGIGDELATKLALVTPGVVPYSVAMGYDRTGKTWAEIAGHFEADYILELSVRFGPGGTDTFRVSPKLLRAPDGLPLWTGEYDGKLDSLRFLNQQAEAAIAVLEELALTVPLGKRQTLEAWPTDNLAAWQEYRRGVELLGLSIYEGQGQGKWAQSIGFFERALELDPDYRVAEAMLSRALARTGGREGVRRAGELARRLIADDDELPQAHLAMGEYYYRLSMGSIRGEPVDDRHDQYALAIEHLSEALRGLPYDPDVEFTLAIVLRRQGEWDAHAELLERAIRRQPDNRSFLVTLATSYVVMKKHERADELLTRYSPTGRPHQVKTYNYLAWGDPARAHEFLVRTTAVTPPPCGFDLSWILVYAAERKFEDIIRQRETASHCINAWIGNMAQSFDLYAALAYRELGMDENASRALAVAAEYYESELKEHPGFHGMHATLGLIYALQGRREEALERARHAVDLWPMDQDAFQGSEPVQFYIRTLAQLGEPRDLDRAIDRLDELLAMPASVTIAYVRNDPFMDPIVAHPRFQELVDRYSPPGIEGDKVTGS